MSNVFIVGNGESRRGFDLNIIKGVAPIYGCNAIYREFTPDYLVSVDDGMHSEIEASNYPKDNYFPARGDDCWEPAACNPSRPRNNAGMYAMRVAISRGATNLICIGFDFLIGDPTQSVSNLYDGTQNYSMETRARFEDNVGRIAYLKWFADNNPKSTFIFVQEDKFPVRIVGSKNIFTISYETLKSNIHRT
jgi:hypothetical protein